MSQSKIVAERRKLLKDKRQENQRYVKQIKQLRAAIWHLKWSIPQIGIQDDIQQLKQSIRIPNMLKIDPPQTLPQTHKQIHSQIQKSQQPKIIKHLQHRKQMLQKLQKLKPQSTLYQSHKRVILKQYLQKLRAQNMKQIQINRQLEVDNLGVSIEGLLREYEEKVKELGECGKMLGKSAVV